MRAADPGGRGSGVASPEEGALVAIVTPTRNRRRLLEETVASVLAQTLEAWELIVVDDASTDDTWAWLQSLDEPRIKPIRAEERIERSAARNLGLRAAQGRYVLFLDDDDLLRRSSLAWHTDALRRNPEAVASIGARTMFTEGGVTDTQRFVQGETVRRVWKEVLLGWVAVSGVSMFRVDAVRAAGAWNESYTCAEDYELWGRIALLGPVVLSPEVVLRYRVHGEQTRPGNVPQLMAEMRRQAVARTAGSERRRGERVLTARTLLAKAMHHAWHDEPAKAIGTQLKAHMMVARLLGSPLIPSIESLPRISVVRSLVRVVAGKRGARLWWRWFGPRGRVEAPRFGAKIVHESDGRWRVPPDNRPADAPVPWHRPEKANQARVVP